MLLNKFFDVERFAVPAFSFGIAVANFFYAKTGSNNVQEEWLTRNVSTMKEKSCNIRVVIHQTTDVQRFHTSWGDMINSWNKYNTSTFAIKTNSYHLHFQRHRWSEIEGFEFLLGLEDVLRPSCNRGWHALTIKGRGQILICESKIVSYCCFLSPSEVSKDW